MQSSHNNLLHLFAVILTAGFSLLGTPASGQEKVEWRTGADLDKQLARPFDLTWDEVPLRAGLTRLAGVQQVAILLDRRVDPDQLMKLSIKNQPLEIGLQTIAAYANIGMSRVGDVIYLGPKETASRLPTVSELQAQFAKSSNINQALKLLDRRDYGWARLATPHDILNNFAEQAGMSWNNLDTVVQHDLWPEGSFPAMKGTDFLTLVLAGYHASYRFEQGAGGPVMELVPIPEELSLTKVHQFRGNHQEAIAKIKQLFPEAKVQSDGKNQLAVTGSAQVQEQVAKLLKGGTARNTIVMPGEKRYTLKTEPQPLGPVLKALGGQLGMEFVLPEGQDNAINQPVAINVKQATLQELLDSIFQETDFTYQILGEKVMVTHKQ